MTTKELLYMEDTLGHEKFLQTKCCEAASQVQDAELKTMLQELENKHKQLLQSIYGLL